MINALIVLTIYLFAFAACTSKESDRIDPRFKLNLHEDKSSLTGVYIPKDLNDCHKELDRMLHPDARLFLGGKLPGLSQEDKYKFEEGYGHLGIGMWIRNNWGLWKGSHLAKHFNAMGIKHPDDMSGIILASYRAKLLNKKYDIDADIRMFKTYWAMIAKPSDYIDPKTGGKIIIQDSAMKYFTKGMVIHEGINEKTGEMWFFVYDRGWYKPTQVELDATRDDSIHMKSYRARESQLP